MKRITLLFFLITISATFLQAQQPSKKMVDEMTKKIADLIRENYVLPDRGSMIARAFLQDHKGGRFHQAQSLKELDSIMTKSLREASNDFHLYTWNNKEIVLQLQSNTDTEEAETTNFFNNEEAYESNFGFEKVEILSGNVGYIKLSQINISEHSLETLYASMNLVKNTKALIIDLRDNGGGGSTVGSVLETFFFNEQVDLLEFRERNGQTELNGTVPWLLEERYLRPLCLLINKGTGSAAEAFAFALKNQSRCVLVGMPTSGGAYMNTYFPVNQDFIVAISTSAPFLPGTTESWEGKGVRPDHQVKSDEALPKALEIIEKNKVTNKQ